jgi:hypothetical protein
MDPPFFIICLCRASWSSTDVTPRKNLVTGESGFTLTLSAACYILFGLISQFLPMAPEADLNQLFLWRISQDQVEHQSLNGGFTGNPSVFLF